MIDTPLGWLLLLVFGLFTGTLAGILGIGGGLLNVPALTLSGASTLQATATSLIGVLFSATSGSVRNLQTGSLNWQVSLTLGGCGILAAQLGAWMGGQLPDAWLSLGFAALTLVTIYLMGLKRSLKQQQERAAKEEKKNITSEVLHDQSSTPNDPPSPIPHPSSTINPPHSTSTPQPTYRLFPTMLIGLTAGTLSGLFGVGGGAVMVPLQMLILNEPIKTAVRTSLGAIVAIASSALIRQAAVGNVIWMPGICLGIGGIIGAQLGTRLLPKLSNKMISSLFRLLLLGLATYMIVRVIVR